MKRWILYIPTLFILTLLFSVLSAGTVLASGGPTQPLGCTPYTYVVVNPSVDVVYLQNNLGFVEIQIDGCGWVAGSLYTPLQNAYVTLSLLDDNGNAVTLTSGLITGPTTTSIYFFANGANLRAQGTVTDPASGNTDTETTSREFGYYASQSLSLGRE